MGENFQRLLTMSDPTPLALNAQAALGAARVPRRSQFAQLVHHFLERFFNHETASPDGDAKARLILIAFTTGLPGFVVALYLWPDYHSLIPHMHNHRVLWAWGPPPYWVQVNQHFFFVVYSFAAVGITTIFEWDLFFPDLIDLNVLGPLPIADARVFSARVAAIAIFTGAFLFDANVFATLVLPAAIDPPNLPRFLLGHILAVGGSGLFAAVLVLALQGISLSLLGERLFRKISLFMQGLTITALLMLMFLFPVFSAAVPALIRTGSSYALFCPPFWFLGVYQSLMEGPAALPIYTRLSATGWLVLIAVAALAVAAYPLAYLRRVRQLVEGPGARTARGWLSRPLTRLLNATVVRRPVRRAVFHFISQTVLRVPRYRIYLVLYGGVGLSVVATALLRFEVVHDTVRMTISADGICTTLGIVPFWVIAGLRMAFVSSGNRQGNWAFRIVDGRPPHFAAALNQLQAAKTWVLIWALAITAAVACALRAVAPASLLTGPATVAQILIAGGMCVLLSDALFGNVTTVAFTGEPAREQSNLAFTMLKYFTFFPVVTALPLAAEPWIAASVPHMFAAVATIATAHLVLRNRFRATLRQHCNMRALEDDEEDFPMKLGLRY